MKIKDILVSGITGTTVMTAFSYLVAELENDNFKEPELLGQLAQRVLPMLSEPERRVTGWTAHYLVGLTFAMAYVELWRLKQLKPSFGNMLLLGSVSGLMAVAIWKATFKIHPLPPSLNYSKFYLQLIPAHIVFAVFAGIGYRLLGNTHR